MNRRVLEKLEWPLLLQLLAEGNQTHEGRERSLALLPELTREKIQENWQLVAPLKQLATQGYKAPVGELVPLRQLFKAAALGQMLSGLELRAVSDLLESTRRVFTFANDLSPRCSTLRHFKTQIYPMPALLDAINKAVGPEGDLLDDASEKLQSLRRQKIALRKRIEEMLRKLLHDSELLPYLQDDFFTVRSERYVVPMRLDGRGRVKGSILDTSDSGQTLFIEPAVIAPVNDQLQELDLEEKLEILRIFRELSERVAADAETLHRNYEALIELDFLTAQSLLAARLDAGTVQLATEPGLYLVQARHPLIKRPDGQPPVSNSVSLTGEQHVLIISGPNAGGKTVILKTVGLLHLMAKAGLLIPASEKSAIYLFDHLYLEMGDAQSLTANLSTFSGHLLGLKPIVEKAAVHDLVLLDELAVGTDPQTGAAIGQAILEEIASRRITALVTTHFDTLKSLAIKDQRFRNGSMEFSITTLKPTYQLILDVPGQSYGLEVAEQMGLPEHLLARAKELRGSHVSALDDAVSQLMLARDQTRRQADELTHAKFEAEAEKERWNQEVEILKENRRKVAGDLAARYDKKVAGLQEEFEELTRKLRQAYKEVAHQDAARSAAREEVFAQRKAAEQTLRKMEGVIGELSSNFDVGDKLPGKPAIGIQLSPGMPVYVLPLKKTGKVLKAGIGLDDPAEVEVGIIKLRVSPQDLRLLSPGEVNQPSKKKQDSKPLSRPLKPQPSPGRTASLPPEADDIGFVIQTATNSIDLRGKDILDAKEAAWNFIDRALLRGETTVILIHGHGTDALKMSLRDALQHECPYDVRFRPGQDQEGGDGITVVLLKT